MDYYQYHLFFCTNQREVGRQCCHDAGANILREYAKRKIKALKLDGVGGVRVNLAGCMGRCAVGPVIVIYPQGIWYTYQNEADIDEIIESYILNGCVVDRLLLPA